MKNMILPLLLILYLNIFGIINAQNQITPKEMQSVFKETLAKSRNFVPEATNIWSFDNSNNDYFKKDTITLNSARCGNGDYCSGIDWSFYENEKIILEKIIHCDEPPTKVASKEEDFMDLKIKEQDGMTYLCLYNNNGIFETFEVLSLKANNTTDEECTFDYTLKLLRTRENKKKNESTKKKKH
ncbi:hypothetical protein [Aquimarina algiphila]|uniref:Uncharacterized protein n=1 Tax=Aquimarina algiphila TaxID=2047982 RepID=A0A554VJ18_9FLAO|nr:hypothetical protein [Aquimarina algiphila]TSE07891.1 hypothetical protein FOF46_14285 [Aquimarina algiphila]